MRTEPVYILAAIRSGLLLLVVFGFDLTDAQVVAVLTFAEAVLAIFTRGQVSPVDSRGELRHAPESRKELVSRPVDQIIVVEKSEPPPDPPAESL